jgi:hypothetical protein
MSGGRLVEKLLMKRQYPVHNLTMQIFLCRDLGTIIAPTPAGRGLRDPLRLIMYDSRVKSTPSFP